MGSHPKCIQLRTGKGGVTLHVYVRTYTSILSATFRILGNKRFELVTHGSKLVICGFGLAARGFELVTRSFELVTCKFEVVNLNS